MAAGRRRSRNTLTASGLLAGAFVFTLLAFSTSYWLQSFADNPSRKFNHIGLWEGCFNQLEHTQHKYEFRVDGCWWLLEEELAIFYDILRPPFFVAVQFFYTMSFILLLVAVGLVPVYLLCVGPDSEHYVLVLRVIGIVLISAATMGTIAVIMFGALGDSRDWMPGWEHNFLSWSFGLAVVGVVAEWAAGTLFLVEGRVQNKKRLRRQTEGSHRMEMKRPRAY